MRELHNTTRDVARELARKYSTMSHDELDILESVLVPRKVAKGERVLHEGDICKSIIYIDKGLNDNVYENCNVLCDNGLLGIVTESYADYAKVRAIIDDHSYITGEIGVNGTICTVEGSLSTMESGYILGVEIDKNANISQGDRVITSNVSDRYLYGITIGYVIDITNDSNNLTKTAKIAPSVDFSEVKDVFVILDRKQEISH